jgi:hypothetical protein
MNRQCSKSTPVRRQASALRAAAATSSIPVDTPPRILGYGRRGPTFDGAEALQQRMRLLTNILKTSVPRVYFI